MATEQGTVSGGGVGSSGGLCRALERIKLRRAWALEQKARASECNDMLKAAGWGLRAAGLADAEDIIITLQQQERPNKKLCEGSGQ